MKILLYTFLAVFIPHEYHVTIIDLNYNDESGKIEISQKIFVDDFEKALAMEGDKITFGDDLLEQPASNKARMYLMNHFSMKVDGQPTRLKFVGAEWDDDNHSMYFYWETEDVRDLSSIDIFNDMFLEVSDDQENMHHFKKGNHKQTLLLDHQKTKGRMFVR